MLKKYCSKNVVDQQIGYGCIDSAVFSLRNCVHDGYVRYKGKMFVVKERENVKEIAREIESFTRIKRNNAECAKSAVSNFKRQESLEVSGKIL